MSKIEKRTVVNDSIERLFAYVPEVERCGELWPGLLEVGEIQYLPLGGAIARWIYRLTGIVVEDIAHPAEPLIDRERALTCLGNIACEMKWHFHLHTSIPHITLDGDYTYWSQN